VFTAAGSLATLAHVSDIGILHRRSYLSKVRLLIGVGTDASQVTYCQIDRHDPNVGWPGYSRPNGTKHTSDAIFMPATALPSGRVACQMTKGEFPMITSGNATLSVLPAGCTKESCVHVPTPKCCTATSGYVELFALFEVQFGRRPYLYETNGSMVILTDASLAGVKLRLTATLPGGIEIDTPVPGGRKWRVQFEMVQLPAKINKVINISLTLGEGPFTVTIFCDYLLRPHVLTPWLFRTSISAGRAGPAHDHQAAPLCSSPTATGRLHDYRIPVGSRARRSTAGERC
jgi:hypothetical protein